MRVDAERRDLPRPNADHGAYEHRQPCTAGAAPAPTAFIVCVIVGVIVSIMAASFVAASFVAASFVAASSVHAIGAPLAPLAALPDQGELGLKLFLLHDLREVGATRAP